MHLSFLLLHLSITTTHSTTNRLQYATHRERRDPRVAATGHTYSKTSSIRITSACLGVGSCTICKDNFPPVVLSVTSIEEYAQGMPSLQ
ncbi:hypothetical protein K504DRAFT_458306, partial [Pleomassaria siparia CBS 279.74]